MRDLNERFESDMNILNTLYGNLELISQDIRKKYRWLSFTTMVYQWIIDKWYLNAGLEMPLYHNLSDKSFTELDIFRVFMNPAECCALILPAGFGIPASWRWRKSDPSLHPHLSFLPSTALVSTCLQVCAGQHNVCLPSGWVLLSVQFQRVSVCVRWGLAWMSMCPKWGEVCMFGWGGKVGKSWGNVAQVQTLSINDTSTCVSFTHTFCPSLSVISGRVREGEERGHDSITHTVWKAHILHTRGHTVHTCAYINNYRSGFLWLLPKWLIHLNMSV